MKNIFPPFDFYLDGFKGDIVLWCKLLLPGAVKRIYNLQSKQLIKLFARLLVQDEDAMLEHLEQGDVAETISVFFENSTAVLPCNVSVLTIHDVDLFLERLSRLTKEEEQIQHFRSILDRCTSNDLKMIVRLIKHDLRINAGPKHILEGIHMDMYRAFQMSRDLEAVIRRFLPDSEEKQCASGSPSKRNKIAISLMTPVLPMLVNLFKDYIARAFPDGDDLILDSEILMVDNETGQPLPFGTLGKHKDPRDLAERIIHVLKLGLEGLVLKNID
ncbi:dna ligase 3, partial [Lasius niger]